MDKKGIFILRGPLVLIILALTLSVLAGKRRYINPLIPFKYLTPEDSLISGGRDTSKLRYPIRDRQGDYFTNDYNHALDLGDPSIIEQNIEYDPETNRYIITETIDGRNVKPPTYLTFEEYLAFERKKAQDQYWDDRAEAISLVEKDGIIPKLYVGGNVFDRLFGGTTVDIRPSGNIDLTFGGNFQKIDNPTLTEQQRKQGGFDFDMNINMNVVGKIGEKVKINMNYNTQATFDFENQIKLNYEGEEDDIIKKIEAGNVSFPLTTSLISGPQSLFGLKTKLQFGRLTLTSVYSQQKSKSESLTIEDGAQTSTFEVFCDQYDENRHFFLSQYFRDNYESALANLPNLNTLANIVNVEVWITNKTGATENTRDVVGFMDLGENESIYRTDVIFATPGQTKPSNNSNNLYNNLLADPSTREIDNVIRVLERSPFDLESVQDFEKTYARKLNQSEYNFHPQLGYLSLNQALFPDEILAVAFEYTFNGQTLKVGEFAQDIPPDSTTSSKVLYLKLLKSTSVRPKLPIWDLMMKNIYSIGAFQVNKKDFKLNVLYQDPGGGEKRYIPEGSVEGIPLISLLNLDNLNSQLDPQPDGVFDFISTPYPITINPNNGRIIFPVLEPFGDDLRDQFADNEQAIADKYVYDVLYDSTKTIAQQFPQFNRFVLEGSYQSNVSSEISLGAFNVPQGSVKVTAGGQQLVENVDYTVDYSLGRVRIINEGVLNSGVPINVSYENNALFGFQTKTLFGARADYWVNDNFSLGGTFMHLRERPFTEKVNIGDDPISNSIFGFDFNYNTESQFLTWLVDKLPFYETKEASSVAISGEMARLKPGHAKAIGKAGTVYIDDFEGSSSGFDLKFPPTSWAIASTPRNSPNEFGNILFPEAELIDSLPYAYNRAKLAWYNIDPLFLRNNSATPGYIENDPEAQSNHYVREILEQEVFPNKTPDQPTIATNILTFDLAYYPSERGPYNYESLENGTNISAGVNEDGTLKDPETRWGGIMRSIDNNDFEASNIEFIEFWVLDPFLYDSSDAAAGELYINLGNISEDVNRDSRKFFENGLQGPNSLVRVDTTNWGLMPTTQPITNAFDNDPDARAYQDVGFDGFNDSEEQEFFSEPLSEMQNYMNTDAYDIISADPSSDDYHYYRGDDYDNQQLTILERYKKYNNPEGNSPISTGGSFSEAATNIPDSEDKNRDNTLNETEEYFQYRIDLHPGMDVGDRFIVDKVTPTVKLRNGNSEQVTWYQFKIPN